jgi:predicted RNA binding protein YcfA (HicA-like mRNA interferase family)
MSTTGSVASKLVDGTPTNAGALIAVLGAPLDTAAAVARPAIDAAADAAAGSAPSAASLITALGTPIDSDGKVAASKILALQAIKRGRQRGKKLGEGAPLLTWFQKNGHAAAVEQLALTPKEEDLIRSLFKKWALDDGICLIDLLGVDLFDEIELAVTDPELQQTLKSRFALCFISSYISGALMPAMQTIFPGLTLSKRYFRAGDHWFKEFEKIQHLLEKTFQAQLLVKKTAGKEALELRQQIQENILAKMKLLIKLWKQPLPAFFLIDFQLCQFNGSSALNKGDPKATLFHLIRQLDFLICAFKEGAEVKRFGFSIEPFKNFRAALQKLQQRPASMEALQEVRSSLMNRLGPYYHFLNKAIVKAREAIKGELTHFEHRRQNKAAKAVKLSQEEFCSQTVGQTSEIYFLNGLAQDFFRIFELRVVPLLFPQVAPLYSLFIRLDWLISQGPYEARQPLPTDQSSSLDLAGGICADFNQMIIDLCAPSYTALVDSTAYQTILNKFEGMEGEWTLKYTEWVPLFLDCKPILNQFNQGLVLLDSVREKVLGRIMQHLETCSLAQLRELGPGLIQTLRESCSRLLRPFCAQTIIFKDIENFINCEIPSSLDDYLYLIPPELANLMQLEGIEERLQALIAEKQKAADALLPAPAPKAEPAPVAAEAAKPAPAAKAEAAKPAAAPHKAPLKLSPAERFRLRSGMNIRTVLRMLKEEGFLPLSQTGSHVKFKKAGGGEVIVPLHKELKPGTLKGIEEQVEDAKAPKKDK